MLLRSAVLTVAASLLLGLWTVGPARAQIRETDAEDELFGLVNAARTRAGKRPLERHPQLDQAALTHSGDMAGHGMLAHVSPRTGTPADRAEDAGLEPGSLAENVALNGSARAAHRALLESRAHRANIMGNYTHVGIAVVTGENGMYVTQLFARLEAEQAAAPAPALVGPWDRRGDITRTAPPAAEAGSSSVLSGLDAFDRSARSDITDPFEGRPPPPPRQNVRPAAPLVTAPHAAAPAPATGERRITGYWVQSHGRWYYYPLPVDAQPGQVLQHDPNVQGTPPRAYPSTAVYRPAPTFGWSPRRQYQYWSGH